MSNFIVTTEDIFAAVHANHEAAAARVVIYLPEKQPKIQEEPQQELRVIETEKAPYRAPAYAWGTAFRMALALAFSAAAHFGWMEPALGGILVVACGLWAVCYWAAKRYHL